MYNPADSMLFGIALTVITYLIGAYINGKTGLVLTNPLLISIILCLLVLKIFKIDISAYMKGGSVIAMLLLPSSVSVGLSIYRKLPVLKEQLLPILIGSCTACISTIIGVQLVGRAMGLNDELVSSLIPKSVTTGMAIDISLRLGGLKSLTIAAVILTGVIGAILGSVIVKTLKLNDPVAIGVALGSASHAAGTAKAMDYGELQGAIAGVCIGVTGFFTSIITLFL